MGWLRVGWGAERGDTFNTLYSQQTTAYHFSPGSWWTQSFPLEIFLVSFCKLLTWSECPKCNKTQPLFRCYLIIFPSQWLVCFVLYVGFQVQTSCRTEPNEIKAFPGLTVKALLIICAKHEACNDKSLWCIFLWSSRSQLFRVGAADPLSMSEACRELSFTVNIAETFQPLPANLGCRWHLFVYRFCLIIVHTFIHKGVHQQQGFLIWHGNLLKTARAWAVCSFQYFFIFYFLNIISHPQLISLCPTISVSLKKKFSIDSITAVVLGIIFVLSLLKNHTIMHNDSLRKLGYNG